MGNWRMYDLYSLGIVLRKKIADIAGTIVPDSKNKPHHLKEQYQMPCI